MAMQPVVLDTYGPTHEQAVWRSHTSNIMKIVTEIAAGIDKYAFVNSSPALD